MTRKEGGGVEITENRIRQFSSFVLSFCFFKTFSFLFEDEDVDYRLKEEKMV